MDVRLAADRPSGSSSRRTARPKISHHSCAPPRARPAGTASTATARVAQRLGRLPDRLARSPASPARSPSSSKTPTRTCPFGEPERPAVTVEDPVARDGRSDRRCRVPPSPRAAVSTSSTVRAIGPTTPVSANGPPQGGKCPVAGTRPGVGLRPQMPLKCAGTRIDPPPSLPTPPAERPAAIAAASPPLDPPGVASRPTGFASGRRARCRSPTPSAARRRWSRRGRWRRRP